MHRPVGRQEHDQYSSNETTQLPTGNDRFSDRHCSRTKYTNNVNVRTDQKDNQQPNFKMKLIAPWVDENLPDHGNQPFCKKNLNVAKNPQYTAMANNKPE